MCAVNVGINPNGLAIQLTFRHRLQYSNHLHRLERKISQCRENTDKIINDLQGFSEAEEHLKNEYLIQKFVLGTSKFLLQVLFAFTI